MRSFTPPCTTSRGYITARVKGAAGDRGVGWRKAACSAVSGKSLARAPHGSPWHGRRRHHPEPCPHTLLAPPVRRSRLVARRAGRRQQEPAGAAAGIGGDLGPAARQATSPPPPVYPGESS